MHIPRLPVALVCLALLTAGTTACGDDEGLDADAAPPVVDADLTDPADAAPTIFGEYTDPSDFDPIGCTPGTMTGVQLDGTWHHDVALVPLPPRVAVVKYVTAGGSVSAFFNTGSTALSAHETTDVRVTDDHVFTRVQYTNPSGTERVRAFYACQRNPDGSLIGKVAYCSTESGCFTGTILAVRVQRIAGEAEAQGLSLVSEFAGEPAAPWTIGITVNVRVQDGIAYLARYEDGLRIVDVGDVAAPQELGWSPPALAADGEIYNDLKLVTAGPSTYALLASSRRGIVAIDVTNPASPTEVATFPPAPRGEDRSSVHTLAVETIGLETRAYLANNMTGGITIYDVTNPANPQPLGAYIHPAVLADPMSPEYDGQAFVHDLYVENGRVYLDYWHQGLVIIDALADPANPAYVGQFDGYERRTNHSVWVTTAGGRKVAVTGDEDFTSHLRVVDVDGASPTFLELIGEFALRPEVSAHNVMAFGDTVYAAWYQDGIRVLDLSDPENPTLAAYYNSWGGPGLSFYEGAIGLDVDLGAGLIYVADVQRGLLVLQQ